MLKDYLNNLKRDEFGAEHLTYYIVSAGSWRPKPNGSANAVFVKDSPQLQICNLMLQMTLSYRPKKIWQPYIPQKHFRYLRVGRNRAVWLCLAWEGQPGWGCQSNLHQCPFTIWPDQTHSSTPRSMLQAATAWFHLWRHWWGMKWLYDDGSFRKK